MPFISQKFNIMENLDILWEGYNTFLLWVELPFLMQPIILIPKLWHLPYLVSKVSSALFNIWIVTHINLSFILLNILLDQISSVLHGVGIKFKTTLPRIFLEFHQDADCARIVNRRRSFWCITHTLLGVAVCWKVHIFNQL